MLTERGLNRFEDMMKYQLMHEWKAQGHYMTGKAVETIEFKAKEVRGAFEISLYALPYATYLERGILPQHIPFGGKTGKTKSMYIEGLRQYVEKRMGITGKKALSIAFAIAHTHKREGMPSKKSMRFSSTGKRTEWINDTMFKREKLIRQFLMDEVGEALDLTLRNFILELRDELKKQQYVTNA